MQVEGAEDDDFLGSLSTLPKNQTFEEVENHIFMGNICITTTEVQR